MEEMFLAGFADVMEKTAKRKGGKQAKLPLIPKEEEAAKPGQQGKKFKPGPTPWFKKAASDEGGMTIEDAIAALGVTKEGAAATEFAGVRARLTGEEQPLEEYPEWIQKIAAKKDGMKLGGGGRFKKLVSKLKEKGGVKDPGAVAAAIGRAKYGKKKMAQMAAAGK